IFEIGNSFARVASQISNVIVRRIVRGFITRQDCLCLIIERSDHCLVGLRVAAKQSFSLERCEIQPIDEWPIAFRRRTLAGEKDIIAALHNCARFASAAEAATGAESAGTTIATNDRSSRICVSCILPPIPEFARRTRYYPRAYVARRAIVLSQQRYAFLGERNSSIAPFSFRELSRRFRERRRQRHHLVAERNLVFQVTAV